MSDDKDAQVEHLMRHLSSYAEKLDTVLAALPIPIRLPQGKQGLISDFLPAVIRAYHIVGEQPIPDRQQMDAAAALLGWITAAELTIVYAKGGMPHHADAALLNVTYGEGAADDLMEWLIDPEGSEPPQD
ncbi:hypothetical protein [Streptomyces odonnellii]|uniref:hypothetical protein n=1 Tax=Streptomyces odonnellii TaxID=1417980 RepID=UPI000625E946|nr:hypothetical protein [Streptomyces odonnellii]